MKERVQKDFKVVVSEAIHDINKKDFLNIMVSVTDVYLTEDYKYAEIFISIFGKTNKDKILSILNDMQGYFRSYVAKKVKMKYIPNVIFKLDNSIEYGIKMDELIKEVNKGKKDE